MSSKKPTIQARASQGVDSSETSSGSAHMTPSSSSSADREAGGGAEVEKRRRGRVNMACLHCRQRKIKCDAQQPQCKNCARLKRDCEYESVTETENQISRERKRLGKAAKQERLKALAQLGIISPQTTATGARRVISKRGNRNDPAAPYVRFTGDTAAKKPANNRSRSDTIAAGSQRPHPGMLDLSDAGPSVLRRSRGITVSGYGSGQRSVMDTMLLEAQQRSSGVNITSLSQPTTPEGTYAIHASMLQSDLTDGTSTAAHPYYLHSPWAAYGATLPPREVPWHEQQHAPSSSSAMSSAQQTPTTWPAELAPESSVWSSTRREQGGLQLSNMGHWPRRRSSIHMLPEWTHRLSNADVAVASFFSRVMNAQPSGQQSSDVVASGLPMPPTIIQPHPSSYQQTSPSDDSRAGSLGRSSSRPISFHDSWGGRSTSSSTHNSSGFGAGSGVDGSNHSSPGQYGVAFRHGSGSTGSSGGPHSPVATAAPYPTSLSSAAMAATSSAQRQHPRLSLGTMPPQMMFLSSTGATESPAATSPTSPNPGFYAAQRPAAQPMYASTSQPTQSAAEASANWGQMRTDAHLGQLSPDTELSHGMRALGATSMASMPSGGSVAYVSPPSLEQNYGSLSPTHAMAGSGAWPMGNVEGIERPAPWSAPEAAATPTWWTSNEGDDADAAQRHDPPA